MSLVTFSLLWIWIWALRMTFQSPQATAETPSEAYLSLCSSHPYGRIASNVFIIEYSGLHPVSEDSSPSASQPWPSLKNTHTASTPQLTSLISVTSAPGKGENSNFKDEDSMGDNHYTSTGSSHQSDDMPNACTCAVTTADSSPVHMLIQVTFLNSDVIANTTLHPAACPYLYFTYDALSQRVGCPHDGLTAVTSYRFPALRLTRLGLRLMRSQEGLGDTSVSLRVKVSANRTLVGTCGSRTLVSEVVGDHPVGQASLSETDDNETPQPQNSRTPTEPPQNQNPVTDKAKSEIPISSPSDLTGGGQVIDSDSSHNTSQDSGQPRLTLVISISMGVVLACVVGIIFYLKRIRKTPWRQYTQRVKRPRPYCVTRISQILSRYATENPELSPPVVPPRMPRMTEMDSSNGGVDFHSSSTDIECRHTRMGDKKKGNLISQCCDSCIGVNLDKKNDEATNKNEDEESGYDVRNGEILIRQAARTVSGTNERILLDNRKVKTAMYDEKIFVQDDNRKITGNEAIVSYYSKQTTSDEKLNPRCGRLNGVTSDQTKHNITYERRDRPKTDSEPVYGISRALDMPVAKQSLAVITVPSDHHIPSRYKKTEDFLLTGSEDNDSLEVKAIKRKKGGLLAEDGKHRGPNYNLINMRNNLEPSRAGTSVLVVPRYEDDGVLMPNRSVWSEDKWSNLEKKVALHVKGDRFKTPERGFPIQRQVVEDSEDSEWPGSKMSTTKPVTDPRIEAKSENGFVDQGNYRVATVCFDNETRCSSQDNRVSKSESKNSAVANNFGEKKDHVRSGQEGISRKMKGIDPPQRTDMMHGTKQGTMKEQHPAEVNETTIFDMERHHSKYLEKAIISEKVMEGMKAIRKEMTDYHALYQNRSSNNTLPAAAGHMANVVQSPIYSLPTKDDEVKYFYGRLSEPNTLTDFRLQGEPQDQQSANETRHKDSTLSNQVENCQKMTASCQNRKLTQDYSEFLADRNSQDTRKERDDQETRLPNNLNNQRQENESRHHDIKINIGYCQHCFKSLIYDNNTEQQLTNQSQDTDTVSDNISYNRLIKNRINPQLTDMLLNVTDRKIQDTVDDDGVFHTSTQTQDKLQGVRVTPTSDNPTRYLNQDQPSRRNQEESDTENLLPEIDHELPSTFPEILIVMGHYQVPTSRPKLPPPRQHQENIGSPVTQANLPFFPRNNDGVQKLPQSYQSFDYINSQNIDRKRQLFFSQQAATEDMAGSRDIPKAINKRQTQNETTSKNGEVRAVYHYASTVNISDAIRRVQNDDNEKGEREETEGDDDDGRSKSGTVKSGGVNNGIYSVGSLSAL